MNEITLKALKGSVEKWHNILHHDGEDNLRGNCPLCMEFSDIKCRGCPVAEKVGKVGCDGTPYEGWSILQNDLDCIAPYKIQGSATREAAQAEYDFLKDLYIEALEATPAKKEVDCPNCGYEPQPGEILVLRDPEYSGELFCPSCKKWYADTLWRMQPTKPRVEKEEWVDITGELVVSIKKLSTTAWYFRLKHLGVEIAYTASLGKGKHLALTTYEPDYKIEWDSGDFRVLKKRG